MPLLFCLVFAQIALSASEDLEYHFIKDPKTWDEAQTFCRKFYTDLATVKNMKELKELERLTEPDGGTDVWIGLHQTSDDALDPNRKWLWSQPEVKYNEGEAKAEWDKGGDGEPDDRDGAENCVAIGKSSNADNKWFDVKCDLTHYSLCYNESSNSTVMIQERRTWLKAQQFCREHHTDLMSGLDQQRQFHDKYPTRPLNSNYWIGLSRDTWAWSDRSNSSFRNWNSDVNPLNHKCAALRAQGRWESDACDLKKPFICHGEFLILVKENKTWEEALVHCRENHRDLVWFIDHERLKRMVQVRAKMADSEAVWVGLHYACFPEAWFWVNGHYVSNTNENWKNHEDNECGMTGAVEKEGGEKGKGKKGEDGKGKGEKGGSEKGRGGKLKAGKKGGNWVKRHCEEKYNFICVR
ncbi:macrophage mannose receptor 1-like [Eucyclogobius newberryi]|uniref:macrophage mannose receptor 1-like n=1 Tax=Eucyclogobius newberryi TaxID=166745 RepID=UPI003B5C8FBD